MSGQYEPCEAEQILSQEESDGEENDTGHIIMDEVIDQRAGFFIDPVAEHGNIRNEKEKEEPEETAAELQVDDKCQEEENDAFGTDDMLHHAAIVAQSEQTSIAVSNQ